MAPIQTARTTDGSELPGVGFHQSWYPVGLARNLEKDALLGMDFLGTRVALYRGVAGKPVVQSTWCPHLGADLSVGQIVDGQIRCAYHHWRFDSAGICVDIPTGDKIPPGAKIFTYPTAEAWGLVWAFNGEKPLFDVPRIPGIEEGELVVESHLRGIRQVPPWVSVSNGVDFQHLRSLHNLSTGTPETIDVGDHSIEYRIETERYLQHGRITGTNTFAQHLRRSGMDTYMLFTGAPIDEYRARSFFVIGVQKTGDGAAERRVVGVKLQTLRDFVEKLMAEDEPVLNTMRFQQGILVASDRHLSRYFKYISEFPKYEPPAV
jgi:phenylpropionate dioxygenase-like ring-hydroxylating dioxygenase large terminal subunit